jgi:hypothetical protein
LTIKVDPVAQPFVTGVDRVEDVVGRSVERVEDLDTVLGWIGEAA